MTKTYLKIPVSLLLFIGGCLLPSISFSEADNSFLMNEIALRTAKSGLSETRKSSIVDFLKSSNDQVDNITKKSEDNKEGYVKRGKTRDLSGEKARIDRIISSGTYQKKSNASDANKVVDHKEKVVKLKETPMKKVAKTIKTASISLDRERVLKKPKFTTKKTTKTKKKRKVRYCLGGSFKALEKRAKKYDKSISKYSKKYGVSKALIKAVITAESCFNPKALSPVGAQGLMQLMPPTAKRFGVSNSYDPDSNIRGGTKYLRFLLKYFKNDMVRVIAAYNAGEGAVKKYKGIPPYKETQHYVKKVATLYSLYSNGKGSDFTAESLRATLLKMNLPSSAEEIRRIIFVPRAMPSSRFSPYKNRLRNISRGNCANKTSTRLKQSTQVQGGDGIWQRIYNAKEGETLSQVMRKTGVHKLKIAQMNGLRSRQKLKMGQRLLVWECRK